MHSNTIAEKDRAHLIHPLVSMRGHERRGPTLLRTGKGVWVEDIQGGRYLDGFAGLWCVNVGYGQDSIVEAATKQMKQMPYATCYFHFGSEPAAELAARLTERAPGDLNHVFFTLGGSDAVDSAVKYARFFWSAQGQPQRQHFVALEKGFHGSTTVGSGLTALPVFHRHFHAPMPTQHHIRSPFAYRHADGGDPQALIRSSVTELKEKVREIGAGNVAAFICEPVQGSGGVIVPPAGWLKAMRDTCAELDILFIADEVITGFGRTGPMFACEHEGVVPDLMTVAKGLTAGYAPMGALFVGDRVYAGIADGLDEDVPFGHGFTYSGHPVSAAVGLAVLDLYEGGLLENGRRSGVRFAERLEELREHPCVGEVRYKGLLAGIELVSDKSTRRKPDPSFGLSGQLFERALSNGILFRAFGDDVIALAPALCITTEEVDELFDRLIHTIDTVAQNNKGAFNAAI